MGSQIIYVKGLGGLGNRLYTLNAAADLAVKHGLDLHVDWNDGHLLRPGEDAFADYITLELPGIRVTSGNRPEWRASSLFSRLTIGGITWGIGLLHGGRPCKP